MKRVYLYISLILFSCQTPPERTKLSHCFCGPTSSSGKGVCGIWSARSKLETRNPILVQSAGSCSAQACQKMAQGVCKRFEMWPFPQRKRSPLEGKKPCYCDQLILERKNRWTLVCASWREGDTHLIEYLARTSCRPSTCSESEFVESKTRCSSFRAYYPKPEDLLGAQTTAVSKKPEQAPKASLE